MERGYIKIEKLKELKGHAKAYFINKKFYPECINVICMDKVHEDYKMEFVEQLRLWLEEGKLFKK